MIAAFRGEDTMQTIHEMLGYGTFITKPGHYWYVFNPNEQTSGVFINGALFTWAPRTLAMRAACTR